MEEDKPAPRPMETHRRLAPLYRPTEENGLIEGLGVIPGETESERVKLEDDFGENYPSGRGLIP